MSRNYISVQNDFRGHEVGRHEVGEASRVSPPSGSFSRHTDEELFDLYRDGVERAFEEIFNRYEGQIKGFLYRRLKDEGRVQDLTQDVFLRVHRAREQYDSARKFSTWIYTIANNLLKNEYRDTARKREIAFVDLNSPFPSDGRDLELEDRGPNPEQLAYKGELKEAIERTIEKLDEHHRVPFVMREVDDLTYEEIAQALGVPVGTIKSRLFRARGVFQALFPTFAHTPG